MNDKCRRCGKALGPEDDKMIAFTPGSVCLACRAVIGKAILNLADQSLGVVQARNRGDSDYSGTNPMFDTELRLEARAIQDKIEELKHERDGT